MSMLPFFPSLKPPILNSIWFNADAPCDDESELRELEKEQHSWVEAIEKTAADINPIGRIIPLSGNDTDDEDANDDCIDTESNDDDEEEEIIETNNTNESNAEPEPEHDIDADNIEYSISVTQGLQNDITNTSDIYDEDTI